MGKAADQPLHYSQISKAIRSRRSPALTTCLLDHLLFAPVRGNLRVDVGARQALEFLDPAQRRKALADGLDQVRLNFSLRLLDQSVDISIAKTGGDNAHPRFSSRERQPPQACRDE